MMMTQMFQRCVRLLDAGIDAHLFLDVIAFGRELVKIAPTLMLAMIYVHIAKAMIALQRLDDAEEAISEGLAACGQERMCVPRVCEATGGAAEGAAADEGAAAAEAEQQAPGVESQPPEDEEVQECAICLQDLKLEDEGEDPWCDEGGEGKALVVLRCGHRSFHGICGDVWCAKCADKGWGVTRPGCRAPYAVVKR
jgi:hypothetical protein